jgi:hypothetical protein
MRGHNDENSKKALALTERNFFIYQTVMIRKNIFSLLLYYIIFTQTNSIRRFARVWMGSEFVTCNGGSSSYPALAVIKRSTYDT